MGNFLISLLTFTVRWELREDLIQQGFKSLKFLLKVIDFISDRAKMIYLLNAEGEPRIVTTTEVNKNVNFNARASNLPLGSYESWSK